MLTLMIGGFIMLNFHKDITIGSVVAELPGASRIFAEYNIDFCCGGHRKLSDVMKEQGIDENSIMESLSLAAKERTDSYEGVAFTTMAPSGLAFYIEDKHHSYLRRALPEIGELLATILRVHGQNHQELFELYRVYGTLRTELEQHLLKEEMMLFPAFAKEDENKAQIVKLSVEIINEHEAAGELLGKINRLTNNYRIPEDVCGTYRRTYEALQELESDLHQHIHLENNILLKKYDVREI